MSFTISNYVTINPIYVFLTCFSLYYLVNWIKRLVNLPPGPWGLPFIGYLPFLRSDTHRQLTELSSKYGPVFSLKLGKYDLVIVNSWPLIKEGFQNDQLLDRPKQTFLPSVIKDKGFNEMSGEPWRAHRRLAMTTLRNVGLGKVSMEKMIQEEISIFLETLSSSSGQPINFADSIALSVSNNISILLFGHRDDYGDPVKLEMERSMADLNKAGHFFMSVVFLPWLAELLIFFDNLALKKLRRLFDLIENNVSDEIEKHKESQSSEINDYIDGYLTEMKSHDDPVFTLTALRRNTSTFYTAGSDTVQTVLNWALLYLTVYPDYQKRIRDEILSVLGPDQPPEYSDRQSLPLSMAFLYELLRVTTIAPISPYRRARSDVTIGNYFIPKDTFVCFNLWGLHRDPNLWESPETFNPERFIDPETSKVIKPPYLAPFSGGRRVCPGESFANLQLFLYLVSIVQKFEILPKPGAKVTLEEIYYFTLRPKDDLTFIFKPIDT